MTSVLGPASLYERLEQGHSTRGARALVQRGVPLLASARHRRCAPSLPASFRPPPFMRRRATLCRRCYDDDGTPIDYGHQSTAPDRPRRPAPGSGAGFCRWLVSPWTHGGDGVAARPHCGREPPCAAGGVRRALGRGGAAQREQAGRREPDWYPAGVAVTCGWLAGAVVQDQTGRRTQRKLRLVVGSRLRGADRARVPGGGAADVRRPDLVRREPGWCEPSGRRCGVRGGTRVPAHSRRPSPAER